MRISFFEPLCHRRALLDQMQKVRANLWMRKTDDMMEDANANQNSECDTGSRAGLGGLCS